MIQFKFLALGKSLGTYDAFFTLKMLGWVLNDSDMRPAISAFKRFNWVEE